MDSHLEASLIKTAARAATWLIESPREQSAEAMWEAGLDRRCIRGL
jgi:hypothetical protein